jgi:predicted dehydrogenase
MAPIRIAFIGLSASKGWASRAHHPYLKQTSKYRIVGILNSSKDASASAVKAYELAPNEVKAYGSPEELAQDSENFDLVVCSARVDNHYDTMKPAIARGKECYVEWPLGKDLKEAEELHRIAKKNGNPQMMVGLQARRAPIVNKVKQLIQTGAIGRVLSVNVQSSAGNFAAVDAEGLGRVLNDASIGATMMNIHFAHMVDYVLYSLGEGLKVISAIISTQRPRIQLKDEDGTLVDFERTSPDNIALQGHLQGGGVLSIHQRGGPPFKDTPGLVWRIYGEKGEIEVTSDGSFLQIGYPNMAIKLHDQAKDTVETIDYEVNDGFESLPLPAQNVARMYEAFADGRTGDFADWEEAVQRHLLLAKMEESSETGKAVSLQPTMKEQLSSVTAAGSQLKDMLFR